MNFEKPTITPEETKTQKEIFLQALDKELTDMESSGNITPEQAKEKRQAATLIETEFSDDPKKDALIFSKAGIAGEAEMIELFQKK